MQENVDAKHHDHQHQRELHEQVAEPPDTPLKIGFGRGGVDALGNVPQLREQARVDNDRPATATHHAGPHKERVAPFGQRRSYRQHPRLFIDGEGFAGQRGFVDKQLVGRQQVTVGGDQIARPQLEHVAGYKLLVGQVDFGTIPEYRRFGHHNGQQVLHGIGRATLLPEAQQPAHQNDEQDDGPVGHVVQKKRQNSRRYQDQRNRAAELTEKKPPDRSRFGWSQAI